MAMVISTEFLSFAVKANNIFIDIDGTITDYIAEESCLGRRLFGNFLFPLIFDMMVEKGYLKDEAERLIRQEIEENIFWDYPDFINRFGLNKEEAILRFRQWHEQYLSVYQDMVELILKLVLRKKIYIISNNPSMGCLLKLNRAGLASSNFQQIFSTDLIKGCKNSPMAWKRALELSKVDPAQSVTIGDNLFEDAEIPQRLGVAHSFIMDRTLTESFRHQNNCSYIGDARLIDGFII